MSHAFDIFPACVQDKLFKTEGGDVCLCLHEAWPSLLGDLALLGPAMLISRSEEMALVSFCGELDFVPVPDGTEMLELNSGLCLDTLCLGAVVAGHEAHSGKLSFHLYDREGRGILKLMPVPGANVHGFSQIVRHYAKGPLPLRSRRRRRRAPQNEGADPVQERGGFQQAWMSFDPALGGDQLPGGNGISWLDALRLAGRERALFLTNVGLIKAILAAHRKQLRLQVTTFQKGMHHETLITPRRLERCGRCLHLFDIESELHFFFDAASEIWIGFHGKDRVPAIHVFSAQGKRRGVIQFAGKEDERESWHQALTSAAGLTSHE
jgi:putative heme degradation protein